MGTAPWKTIISFLTFLHGTICIFTHCYWKIRLGSVRVIWGDFYAFTWMNGRCASLTLTNTNTERCSIMVPWSKRF